MGRKRRDTRKRTARGWTHASGPQEGRYTQVDRKRGDTQVYRKRGNTHKGTVTRTHTSGP